MPKLYHREEDSGYTVKQTWKCNMLNADYVLIFKISEHDNTIVACSIIVS